MMKDVIIKIDQNSMVYKQETVLGISYENLQGKIIFKFLGTFPKGIAYLEYERDSEKGYLQMNQVGEEYQLEIKSSLLTKEGRIYLQLRVTEDATPEGIPVFKSNKFYLEVKEAINATAEIPDEYPEWIDTANEKIKEMDNLNITTERVEDGVDIVLTDKKGVTTRTEVKDGAPGPVGPQGAPGAVKMQVVDTLPETGETDTIYLVKKNNPGEQNLYDEYVYTDTGWEHIGDTSVDLSNYYTKEESDTKLNKKQDKLPIYYASVYTPIKDLLPIFNSWLSDYKRTNMMPMFSMGYSDTPYTGNSMYLKSVEYNNTTKLWYFNFSSTIGELSAPITQEIYMLSYDSENEVFLRCQKAGHNGQYLTPMYDFSKGASFGKRALSTTNTEEYTPTADYHPATKKYVDDNVKTYTAGDNITISEDNVISSNIGLPVLENQEINIHTFPVGSYIITGKDTVIKYGVNGASSYKPITTNSYTGNTDSWVLNISHDSGSESNRGFAFLFRKYGSSGTTAFYTFDFSGMESIDINMIMQSNTNQSIYGQFDFYHALPISSLVPSTDNELTNKKYVDDAISSAITTSLEASY